MRLHRLAILGLSGIVSVGGCAERRSGGEGASEGGLRAPGAVVSGGADCRARAEGPKLRPIDKARQGSTVALGDLGGRMVALVADEDARAVVMFDAEKRVELSSTPVDGTPSQLLIAADGRVLVALRDKAKVIALEQGNEPYGRLTTRCAIEVATEPVAFAMTPDDATILVSSGWGHTLAAYEAATLAKRFDVDLPREPRSIVVSGDGKRAFVTHAVGARMSAVDLASSEHPVTSVAVNPGAKAAGADALTSCQGYALARLAGPGSRVLAPMVVVNPGNRGQRTAGYGDVNVPTERPGVAVFDESKSEVVAESMPSTLPAGASAAGECLLPRAAVVDDESRTLLVACYGVDAVIAYDALAPSPANHPLRKFPVGGGPSGLAVDPATGRAWVWSQFERTLSMLSVRDVDPVAEVQNGVAPVARTSFTPVYASADAYRWAIGRQLFHAVGDTRISGDGRACASCHPDGRDDALTWATPDGPRRTAMLSGRLKETAPYGWNGASTDVREHVRHTFERLRGSGVSSLELDALLAYLQSLEPPGVRREGDPRVARGDALFHSSEAACARCHRDATAFTDGQRHNVASRAEADRTSSFDTPSLRFIGARAPYFHDGRYATLAELLKATATTMGNTERLSPSDLEDLEAYLRSL